MDCRTARELLLEAEPNELNGDADSPLAAHFAMCESCRSLAATLRSAMRELARGLDAPVPRAYVERAVRNAIAAAPRANRRRRFVSIGATATAAVSVAAAVVALLIRDSTAPEPPEPVRMTALPATAPERPVVNAPANRDVAVFDTSDPRITVVWYFPSEESR